MENKYYPPHIHICNNCNKTIILSSYPITKENLECCYHPKKYICTKCKVVISK